MAGRLRQADEAAAYSSANGVGGETPLTRDGVHDPVHDPVHGVVHDIAALERASSQTVQAGSGLQAWWRETVTENPVFHKERRALASQRRNQSAISRFLGALFGIGIILAAYVGVGVLCVTGNSEMGHNALGGLLLFETMMMCLIAPSQSAGMITSERERQTWNALLLSRLSPSQIVLGKLVAALEPILTALAIFLPLNIALAVKGQVNPGEFFLSHGLLLLSIFASTAFGLYCSFRQKRTAAASSMASGMVALLLFVTPCLSGLLMALSDGNLGWWSSLVAWINPIFGVFSSLTWTGPLTGPVNAPLGALQPWATTTYLLFASLAGWWSVNTTLKNLWKGPKDFTG